MVKWLFRSARTTGAAEDPRLPKTMFSDGQSAVLQRLWAKANSRVMEIKVDSEPARCHGKISILSVVGRAMFPVLSSLCPVGNAGRSTNKKKQTAVATPTLASFVSQ